MIIALLNQKGGVGKTTLAVNLAAAFARRNLRVLAVDADPQGSMLAWHAARETKPLFPVLGAPKATLHKDIAGLAANYDVTVIDGAPRVNDLARSAILAADLVLIPVQPSPLDIWATEEIVALIEEARIYRDGLEARFVVNRRIANTVIGRDVRAAFEALPFPVTETTVSQRVAFAETIAAGSTVIEAGGPAAREIEALAREIGPAAEKQKRRTA